jgi:hypothetical protein
MMSEPLEMNVDFETSDTEMNMETDMNCNIKVPLPIASATQLGGIKVGENLSIAADGTLSAEGSEEDIEQLQEDMADVKSRLSTGLVVTNQGSDVVRISLA